MKHFLPELIYVEIPNGDIMDDPTNMFIIGRDPVMIVDPGSIAGLDRVAETIDRIGNPHIEAILLTHVHVDHGESADEVRRLFHAPVRFHELELPELQRSSHHITLDDPIENGEIIEIGGFRLEAVLTPGHARGHLSFIDVERNFGIVGDLITGWGSSAIFPPWGDLADYLNSMRYIAERGTNPLLPSHGDPVTNGPEALRRFVERRLEREAQILSILRREPLTVEALRDELYEDVPQDLISDVTGNVVLHLEKLEREGHVRRSRDDGVERFSTIHRDQDVRGTRVM